MEEQIAALLRGEAVAFSFCQNTTEEIMDASFKLFGVLIEQPITYRKLITADGLKAVAWIDGLGHDPIDGMFMKEQE